MCIRTRGHGNSTLAKHSQKAINFVPFANLVYSGTNDTKKKLVIIFDKNDKVLDYLITENKGETGFG